MIVDSSALMAIVNREPGSDLVLEAIASTPARMSAATWVEVGIVADARSTAHGERLDKVIAALEIELVPVTPRVPWRGPRTAGSVAARDRPRA